MICRICQNETNNAGYDVPEMMYGTGEEFKYFRCAECGCLQISEIPSDMSAYYPEEYYSYDAGNSVGDRNRNCAGNIKAWMISQRDEYAAFGKGIIGKALYRLFPTSKYKGIAKLKLDRQSSILDVGCGAGLFLSECAAIGYKNVMGIDPFNKSDIELPGGIRILKKELADMDGKWDLITFHHSFEHISNQLETLRKASSLLSTGGTCMIRIPTVSSYAWRHYGINWVQLDAPRHFYLHSIKSMKILGRKAGLELFDVEYDSTAFQFWGSEQYKQGIPLCDTRSHAINPKDSIFSDNDISAYEKQAQKLNKSKEGDQAIFYFKNPARYS